MKHKKTGKLLTAFTLVVLLIAVFAGSLYAASKDKKVVASKSKTADVKAWDCAGCHKDKKVIPDSHMAIKEMPYEGCLVCHLPGEGKAGTLKAKIPGSHLHALKGVKCEQCHGKVKKKEPVEMAKCVACHGATAKLAEKTAKVKPQNPHESPHYGTDADCNLCHHQHAKSENLCAQCHKFEYVVP
jgi:hypothetical protein